jgi:hypothetical protein
LPKLFLKENPQKPGKIVRMNPMKEQKKIRKTIAGYPDGQQWAPQKALSSHHNATTKSNARTIHTPGMYPDD